MVRAKKHLGQHFLHDKNIAHKIVTNLIAKNCKNVLEIGPGTGVLTSFLTKREDINLKVIEIDIESVEYLNENYEELHGKIIEGDFIKTATTTIFNNCFCVIGNLPYNISSQIFFKILENRDQIPEVVVMIQKEVADRIASKHGNKTYGILSVLIQAFYDIKYLFSVSPKVFTPPPKVVSAVISFNRNETTELACDEKLFFKVVKQSFNHRRKTLRNSLKPLTDNISTEADIFNKRPEQLSVDEFVILTKIIEAE